MAQADRGSNPNRTGPSAGSSAKAPGTTGPGSGVLWAAVVLAALAAGWAAFQWQELAAARAGGEVTCVFGEGSSCAAAWNSPFARRVEGVTRLPVAAWGLLWGILAMALPLGALLQRARGVTVEPWWTAARWMALGGAVVAVGLAALLLGGGSPCGNCLLTHGLVLGYAAVCLARGPRLAEPVGGAALAGGAGVIGFALLLMLAGGPWGESDTGADSLAAVPRVEPGSAGASASGAGPDVADPAAVAPGDESPGDRALREYLAALSPPARQAIADALASWARNPSTPIRPPRALIGSATAPVRITEFADALCSHCASLHRTLSEIRKRVPSDSLAIEPRHFPLDGACNPQMNAASKDKVRCTAARTLICLEGNPRAFDVASEIFDNQRHLDEAHIFAAAKPYLGADELRTCLTSAETGARLQADIDWAVERGIRGTPLVLVNGREAVALPTFLYSLVLAAGDPGHPAFALLPAPRPGRSGG